MIAFDFKDNKRRFEDNNLLIEENNYLDQVKRRKLSENENNRK